MGRIKIEDIRSELEKDGWKVISEEYVNLDAEMVFECEEGHQVYNSWRKIRQKRECPVCKTNLFKNTDLITVPKKGNTRVLALDQATKITGWSVYDDQKLIKYGVFKVSENDEEIIRYTKIKNWLISMINIWSPDCIGIEGIQFQDTNNEKRIGITVFEMLARLQGILMQTCYEYNIKYIICPTNTWRNHCQVKGRFRADRKKSMQMLVKKWYDVSITDDEADAIGIGKYVADTYIPKPKIKITNWE